MLASLSDNTLKQYDTCLKKWYTFCQNNHLHVFNVTVADVLNFLSYTFDSSARYGTINTCRSALSLLLGQDIVNNDLTKRFLRGVFRLRPTLPKYNLTWNVDQVLDYLSNWYPNEKLNLDQLSKKLTTLLALVTGHRVQTLSVIDVKNIKFTDTEVIIQIPAYIKRKRCYATDFVFTFIFTKTGNMSHKHFKSIL